MQLLFYGTAVLTAASALVTAVCWVVLRLAGRRQARFWRRALWIHLALVPCYLLVVMPGALGFLASRFVGTRGDERAYTGPRILADGTWQMQSRDTLRREAEGAAAAPGGAVAAARARTVALTSLDGVALRAFFVPAAGESPRASALLVHGLFRGALELEPVAAMFRELGCEVLMLELRNHGGSGRAAPTFGRDEAQDVIAAARWLRDRDGQRPLVLFGVSLGTVAVALASRELRPLGGLVLDAPIEDLLAAAHRMLTDGPRPGRRGFALWQPFRSVTLWWLELFCGFRFAEVRPLEALSELPAETPVLVIGGGGDRRVPPEVVREVFRRVPARADDKRLWIRAGSDHGQVWTDDPEGYRAELAWLLDRVR